MISFQWITLSFLLVSGVLFAYLIPHEKARICDPGSQQRDANRERQPYLGHTNIETTQIYAKITVQKLDNDLTMLGDKLSKSFGNVKMSGI